MLNQFNDLSIEWNWTDSKSLTNFKHYDINEIQKIKEDPSSFSLFQINTCSLNKNFDDLRYLPKTTNQDFDIIAISESRFKKYLHLTSNINLLNYVIEYTPIEDNAGGTYINNKLLKKPRPDVNIYKSCEPESTFITVVTPKNQI